MRTIYIRWEEILSFNIENSFVQALYGYLNKHVTSAGAFVEGKT